MYVRREGAGTSCEPFDAGALKSLDDIVKALGFDRGELLTTVSMFLVVEGIHDVAVLEAAFEELRAARIALLPMEGLSNYKAVLDSDTLWRYTRAGVALSTDKFPQDFLQRLVGDPEVSKELRRASAPEESKMLARLVGAAQRNGKQIQLLGHSGSDLIDVIDEDIVKAEFPRYPGHQEAERLWAARVAAGAKAGEKKNFYDQEFGLPMRVESYEQLGRALQAAGRKPAALKAIVDDAVRLALGQPAESAVSTLQQTTPES